MRECGERLATRGLSFFMINVVVDKHSKASPQCRLRVDLDPEGKKVDINPAWESTAEQDHGNNNPR
jgi:hypothetical protein